MKKYIKPEMATYKTKILPHLLSGSIKIDDTPADPSIPVKSKGGSFGSLFVDEEED